MKSLRQFIREDDREIERDGAGPPNATRKGLWRILAISLLLAVAGLVVVALFVG